jgi:hypothetical protein
MNIEQANFDLSGNSLVAGKLPFRSILQELPRLGFNSCRLGFQKAARDYHASWHLAPSTFASQINLSWFTEAFAPSANSQKLTVGLPKFRL